MGHRPRRTQGLRRLAIALALVGIVGALFYALTRNRPQTEDVAASAATQTSPAPAQDDSDVAAFRTRLLPDGGVGAVPASVRIGIARISADSAADYRAWVQGGRQGAGPSDPLELADVVRWLPAPATALADGSVQVGPLPLPAADAYVLEARGSDDLRHYRTRFAPAQAPTQVRPQVAAALRVRVPAQAGGRAALLLRRVENPNADAASAGPASADLAQAALWRAVQQRDAPRLLAVFDDTPLALGADTRLAPLPPGPLDAVVMVGGIEVQRQRVTLIAGQTALLDVDAQAAADGAALAATLRLRVVETDSDAPIPDVVVQWDGEGGQRSRRSDADGRVDLGAVDPLRPLAVELRFPEPPLLAAEALPDWPEALSLRLTLADLPVRDGRIEHTLRVRRLRWLLAQTPGLRVPRQPRGGAPYPVFLLQRREDGDWRDASAARFAPIEGGMAVALDAPGEVRVIALTAPWQRRIGPALRIDTGSAQRLYRTQLPATGDGRDVELTLLDGDTPLPFAQAQLLPLHRGAPPSALAADRAGRLRLPRLNAPVLVQVPGYAEATLAPGQPRATLRLRRESP